MEIWNNYWIEIWIIHAVNLYLSQNNGEYVLNLASQHEVSLEKCHCDYVWSFPAVSVQNITVSTEPMVRWHFLLSLFFMHWFWVLFGGKFPLIFGNIEKNRCFTEKANTDILLWRGCRYFNWVIARSLDSVEIPALTQLCSLSWV